MPLVVKDRVKETTTTTGTGAVTLAGPAAGFQSFSVIGNGNTTYYAIVGGTEWEVGIGTYSTTGPTLTRDTVLESSNSGSLVNFSAGAKDVFVTYPAEKAISYDASDNVGIGNTDPAYKLEVTAISTGGNAIGIRGRSSDNIGTLNFSSNDGATSYGKIQGRSTDLRLEAASSNTMTFYTNVTERMRITNSGYVSIGSTTPGSSKLYVYDANVSISTNEVAAGGTGVASSRLKYSTNHYGIYVGSVNAMVFYDYGASAERMRLDAFGNLLVGTTTTRNKLTILGNAVASPTLGVAAGTAFFAPGDINYGTMFGTAGSGLGWIQQQRVDGTATAYDLALQPSGGNVGIGTSSPGYKLDVTGSARVTSTLGVGGAPNSYGVVQVAGDSTDIYSSQVSIRGTTDRNKLLLVGVNTTGNYGSIQAFQDGTGALPLALNPSGGNVGIGTSSPTSYVKLTVAGGLQVSGAIGSTTASAGGVISNESPITRAYVGDGTGYSWAFSKRSSSTTTDLVTILDSGNVGIGTSSPGVLLDVFSAAGPIIKSRSTTVSTTLRGFEIQTGNDVHASFKAEPSSGELRITSGFSVWGGYQTFHTNGSERMRIDSSGNVGIGTSSPGYKLDVVAADTTANLGYALRLRHNTTASAATIQFTDDPVTVQYAVITSNTSEFTLRSGSTRPFTVWTNGSERLRIGPSGQIGLSGANYGTSGQVLTSNGSGSAPTWQAVSSKYELISTSTASAASTVDFTGLSNTYSEYIIVCRQFFTSANALVGIRTSTNNGTSYDSAANTYGWSQMNVNTGGTAGGWTGQGTEIACGYTGSGSEIDYMRIHLVNAGVATRPMFDVVVGLQQTSYGQTARTIGWRQATTAINAIRIFMSSGTITGTFYLYGVRT